MMVGLDFFFGKRKSRTEVEVPVASLCFVFPPLMKVCRRRFFCLSIGGLGVGN